MRIGIAIGITVIAAIALILSGWPYELYMRSRAAQFRAEIERYHNTRGNYPISVADIAGAPLNGPLYYERSLESPDIYYIWFGTGFGTVSQYDSKTRTWHGPQ